MFFTDNEKGSVFEMLPFLLFLKTICKIVLRPIQKRKSGKPDKSILRLSYLSDF
jgi:hypothetical protein